LLKKFTRTLCLTVGCCTLGTRTAAALLGLLRGRGVLIVIEGRNILTYFLTYNCDNKTACSNTCGAESNSSETTRPESKMQVKAPDFSRLV
jgi:hypothetical protein